MNEYDRNNLHYIMSLSDKEFDEWSLEICDDDIKYAIEIIQAARVELAMQEQELLDNQEELNLAEANAVLKKFML